MKFRNEEGTMQLQRLVVSLLLTVVLGTISGCRFDSDFLNARVTEIDSNIEAASLIFRGRILSIGEPPLDWSGFARYFQVVTYTVERVLKGALTTASVSVRHTVVFGSRHAIPVFETPGLNPQIFSSGAILIVFATVPEPGILEDVNSELGTIPFSIQNEQAVEVMIAARPR
jgi:hypothetical protein